MSNSRDEMIGHLSVLKKEIADELGIDVTEIVHRLESNFNENDVDRNEVAVMRSFLNMTSKYVNILRKGRKNILRSICLMIPFGMCFLVSLLLPPVKPFAAAAASFFKYLLQMDSKPRPNIDAILRTEIEMDNIEDEVIRLSARFQRAYDFLDGMCLQNVVTNHQVEQMIDRIGIYIGAKEMGKLESVITKNVGKNTYIETIKAISCLLQYVRVHLLYTRLYHQMAVVANTAYEGSLTENNSFNQFGKMYTTEKQRVEGFIRNLFAPCHRKATFFAIFEVSKHPELKDFLSQIGVKLNLSKSKINVNIALAMQSKPGIETWMNMANNPWGTIWKSGISPEGNRIQFKLIPVPEEKNWFFLVSARWTSWFAVVENNTYLRGTTSMPGNNGKFKFVKVEDTKYMITVKSLPGKFIYMEESLLERIKISKSGRPYSARFWWLIKNCNRCSPAESFEMSSSDEETVV